MEKEYVKRSWRADTVERWGHDKFQEVKRTKVANNLNYLIDRQEKIHYKKCTKIIKSWSSHLCY